MVAFASMRHSDTRRPPILQTLNLLFDALMIRFEDTVFVVVF